MKCFKSMSQLAVTAGILIGTANVAMAQCQLDQFSFDEGTYGFRWDAIWAVSSSVDGNRAIIGAPFEDPNGVDSGAAYIYQFDGIQWQLEQKLLPSDGDTEDLFGHGVDIQGDRAIVGAWWDEPKGSYSGSAYVFHYNGSTWVEEAKLINPNGAAWDQFGGSVAIYGMTAVVSAFVDDEFAYEAGSVSIFQFDGSQWQFQTKIVPHDLSTFDGFGGGVEGNELDIEGNRIAAGSANVAGGGDGAVYIFDFDGASWIESAKLVPAGGSVARKVDLNGDQLIIGAKGTDGLSGAAYIFDFDGTGWAETAKIVPSQHNPGDQFGLSVSLSGNTAVIGAPFSDLSGTDAGAAFVFHHSGSQWVESANLLPQSIAAADHFGNRLASNGQTAICGTLLNDTDGTSKASAYFFDLNCPASHLDVSPSPLVGRQDGIFTVTGALPDELTWMLYSLDGLGQTFIRSLNVIVDLNQPKLAFGPGRTDVNGDWVWTGRMPAVIHSFPVWFQGVQRQNVTNYVGTEIVP